MKKYYFVKLDKNNFYLSFEIGDQYDTWGSDTLRLESIPEFDENKYYKYENNNWIAYDVYPDIEEIVEVPQTLTPRQIRMQLTNSGLRQQVEDIVANSNDYALKDWWEYSLDYKRDNPILIDMATQLELTDEQIDDMFIQASKL